MAVLSDGRLASGSQDSLIKIWPVDIQIRATEVSVNAEVVLNGHTDWVLALATLPLGRLASGSKDKTIKVWDMETRQNVATLKSHTGWVTALALLHDNNYLASGSLDTTIRVWDLIGWKEVILVRGEGLGVTAIAVLANGRIATGSRDKILRIWTHTQSSSAHHLERNNRSEWLTPPGGSCAPVSRQNAGERITAVSPVRAAPS